MEKLVTGRIKIGGINEKLLSYIMVHGEALGLYDKRFEENNQCGGWFAFKHLCLMKDDLPNESYVKENGNYEPGSIPLNPGMYTLGKIHKNLRNPALQSAKQVRKFIQSKLNNDKLKP